ncbi:MAG: hypothetical protein ACOX47_06885 [Bacillota bacterium]|jgi:DNA repair photolyase
MVRAKKNALALIEGELKSKRKKGVVAGVLLMPVLPFIEDTEDNISRIIDHSS